MTPDLIQPIASLGVGGIAVVIIWWMYQDTARRLDRKDEAFRTLEKEVRTEISVQLAASTSALRDNSKVMEHVVDKLGRSARRNE